MSLRKRKLLTFIFEACCPNHHFHFLLFPPNDIFICKVGGRARTAFFHSSLLCGYHIHQKPNKKNGETWRSEIAFQARQTLFSLVALVLFLSYTVSSLLPLPPGISCLEGRSTENIDRPGLRTDRYL
jgi:hypothetical protein